MSISRPERVPHRRIRTPTVLQMESAECGAAALAMVLGYFGRHVPLEVLRVECGVSRDGSRADLLAKVGRRYGLAVRGYRAQLEDLVVHQLPLIVFWEFRHFLVVEGFSARGVHLNDPACGRRILTWDEFSAGFTGVALGFEKTESFRPGGQRPGLLALARGRFGGYAGALAHVLVAGLLLIAPALAAPAFGRLFIDGVLVRCLAGWTSPLLAAMALGCLLSVALTWLQTGVLMRLSASHSTASASALFWHLLRLPIQFFVQRSAGDLVSRIGASSQVAQLLTGDFVTTGVGLLAALACLAAMGLMDRGMTGIAVAVALLDALVFRAASRRIREIDMRLQRDFGRLWGLSMVGLRSIETLKATGRESEFFGRWAGLQATVLSGQQDVERLNKYLSLVPTFTTAIAQSSLLALGGYRVMQGSWSIGSMLAFQILMSGFFTPLSQLMGLGFSLQLTRANWSRVDDIEHHPLDEAFAEPESTPGSSALESVEARLAEVETLSHLSGLVEIKGVTFGYNPVLPPLVDGLSLTIAPGRRVALVGATGSGKSTVAALLMGLYQPWAGEILIDGRPVTRVPREVRAEAMAMVSQETCLFAGTVADNLTLWDPHAPERAILDAARDACLHDVVTARPGGYASLVEEGGRNFSGGEAQRLEIARALVGRPRVLVLDEATGSLDARTEQQIDSNLRRRGCTCLIIAHRLSTIRDSDEIIVLDQGQVVERGTHDSLIAADGPYARLVKRG